MKSPVWILLLLLIPTSKTFAQQNNSEAAFTFLRENLTEGEHKANILTKDIPAELNEIITKYRRAVNDSSLWYVQYCKEQGEKTPLPYHANFGITQTQYDQMNTDISKLKMKTKATKGFTISQKDNKITFKGEDPFTIFDAVVFDLDKKTLLVDGDPTPLIGEISEGESSSFGQWKGFKWMKEEGNIEDAMTGKIDEYYMVDIQAGKTVDNKILLQFKTTLIQGGQTKIKSQVSTYVN